MRRAFVAITSALTLTFNMFDVFAADLVEAASSAGTFKTFLVAAQIAGLTETLRTPGPYTIFAPTDSAFDKLPPGTLDALLKDKHKLAQIISYLVILGKVPIADIKPGKVKTIQGNVLTLTSDNGKVTVDNANVIQSDLMADNGVIHEIDAVVLPK